MWVSNSLEYLGYHLILDGIIKKDSIEKARNEKFVLAFFDDVTKKIKEKIKTKPQRDIMSRNKVRTFCFLESGHINVLSDFDTRRFSIEIFSENLYDRDQTTDYILQYIGIEKKWSHFIHRMWIE